MKQDVTFEVRLATPEDTPELEVQLKAFREESGVEGATDADGHKAVGQMMANNNVFILSIGDMVIGSAGMERSHEWWSEQAIYYVSRWIYVKPEFRTPRAAMALIELLQRVAEYNGAPFVLSVMIRDGDKKSRFFRRFMDQTLEYLEVKSIGGEFTPK